MKKVFFTTLLSIVYCLPVFTHAQVNFGGDKPIIGSLASELTVNLSPTYPGPGDTVSVDLQMYTEDLNSAAIAWYVDGKLITKGKGLKNFSFQAPRAGSSLDLSISITLASGTNFEKDITISPAGLEILWQANSYTPPFYRGKALFGPQGSVRIEAIPHFSSTNNSLNNNSGLVYKWTINGEVAENLGGFGKNIAVINGPILGKDIQLDITATDPNSGLTAEGAANIEPYNPEVVFYEDSPLYGIIFEKALNGSFDLSGSEANIISIPYNISEDNIKYSWEINGIAAPDISGREAIFRKPDGVAGSSNISLNVTSPNRPLQSADGSFLIKFDNTKQNNGI